MRRSRLHPRCRRRRPHSPRRHHRRRSQRQSASEPPCASGSDEHHPGDHVQQATSTRAEPEELPSSRDTGRRKTGHDINHERALAGWQRSHSSVQRSYQSAPYLSSLDDSLCRCRLRLRLVEHQVELEVVGHDGGGCAEEWEVEDATRTARVRMAGVRVHCSK